MLMIFVRAVTPPKTNMEPENTPLEKEKFRPKPLIFGFKMFNFGAVIVSLLEKGPRLPPGNRALIRPY